MKRALERHENGTAKVIPIILRHVDYEGALFSHLQALPTDAVPVTDRKWRNRDEAFLDVAKGIRKVVKELLSEQCLYEGNIYLYRQQYDEALMAFEKAIYHNPASALAYVGKGQTLNQLASEVFISAGESTKALAAFEKAIELDPTNSHAYEGKGTALFQVSPTRKTKEVLSAYEQSTRFDPKNVVAYIGQGKILMYLSRYEEALAAYEKAISIATFPNQDAYEGKEETLYNLEHYEEAVAACEQTNQEFPDSGYPYEIKGNALYHLNRFREALPAYEKAISLGQKSAKLFAALGDVLFQLDYDQKALDAYEQAIQLNPYSPNVYYKNKANVLKYLAEQALKQAEETEDPLGDLEDHPF
jgi:tetratricopeptide (TPR) repeat protein